MHNVASQFTALRKELNGYFLERYDSIEACLLALVCGQHVFLLGQPGTAKTLQIRAIVKAIIGARYFEIGLSRNRPPEAVMGPLDIQRLREHGDYVYKRKGFAGDCEIILLNEVGKMSDDLGHDLLALLNERIVHEVSDGLSAHAAPLSTAFCDSNEMLTEGTDDAAAMWDRLLLRCVVETVQADANFAKLLSAGPPSITTQIAWEELHEVITKVVPSITIPDTVLTAMVTLRRDLAEAGVNPSSRRFRQSMDVMRAAAFLAGRDEVDTEDIAVLRFTLWDTTEQIQNVDRICRSAANPFVGPLLTLADQIGEIRAEVDSRYATFTAAGSDWDASEGSALQMYSKEANRNLGTVRDKLDTMLLEAGGRPIPGFKKVSDLHHDTFLHGMRICLNLSNAAAEEMFSKRAGDGDGGNVE